MRSDADILILDEPTAAMDAASEAAIFEHFRLASRDKFTILISHRFSTVGAADHIVVIQHGEIIEQGNHEELLAENGHYAHLFKLQARGYQWLRLAGAFNAANGSNDIEGRSHRPSS